MTDTPSNVTPFPADHISAIQFPAEEIAHDAPTQDHDVFPPMIVLPYQDPLQRTLGTMGKQAVIAGGLAFLLGLTDLIAGVSTGQFPDQRIFATAIASLATHAALVALKKYTDASKEDEASQ